jgi:hypothetical protein
VVDHPVDHPDDPTGPDQIDEASNLSRPDPSGADQIDAEHQATDLAVGRLPERKSIHTGSQRPKDAGLLPSRLINSWG